jgi:hypothetical protein
MCTEECPNVSVSREYVYVIHTLNPLTPGIGDAENITSIPIYYGQ